ncbi:hypothetical protein A3C37_02420 [Candidatus Peribacteria bacterium RIFCSPHIGHO2_02_FULL_53_20]|nr:MAG: hypothetical protein A3C37_02420 [Candidatus Peribacteria bacterium RIFCSPHIGHO2_02_FULL_53_20]OGJ67044.1 MAG: hypothetical protein A3B61_00880 [Candidatus Peribacteria bacterium RIFCSPLOWO2_01_FULL_53_10]OGJ73047.1 MAG: hypothetical protein A3G69_04240 [Candidatus Peribacteria bacterium RIFCSPLOWO2_12_FULL_53_10]
MQLLASLLLAAATVSGSADASASCVAELNLEAVPTTNTTHLFLYRRCLNIKKAAAESHQKAERRLQRLDQYFWRDKEVGEEQKTEQEAQLKKDIRWNQTKRTSQQQSGTSRADIMKASRRKVRGQVRLLEKERDAKGEEK